MRAMRAWPRGGRLGQRCAVRRIRHRPARPRGRLRQGLLALACLRHLASRSPTGSGSVSLESEPISSCHSTVRGSGTPGRSHRVCPRHDDGWLRVRFGISGAYPDRWVLVKGEPRPPPLRRCGIPRPHAARSRAVSGLGYEAVHGQMVTHGTPSMRPATLLAHSGTTDPCGGEVSQRGNDGAAALVCHRTPRKNVRTSPTRRSGASMAAKWPPRSNSDQCTILLLRWA